MKKIVQKQNANIKYKHLDLRVGGGGLKSLRKKWQVDTEFGNYSAFLTGSKVAEKILIPVTHWKEPYTKSAMVREKLWLLCCKEIESPLRVWFVDWLFGQGFGWFFVFFFVKAKLCL